MQRLMSTMGPAAMAAAIAKLRPHIEAKVNAHGLTWDDVLPAFELIDNVDEVVAAIDDAEAFLIYKVYWRPNANDALLRHLAQTASVLPFDK